MSLNRLSILRSKRTRLWLTTYEMASCGRTHWQWQSAIRIHVVCCMLAACCRDRSVETRPCPTRTCIRRSSGRFRPRSKCPSRSSLCWNTFPGRVSPPSSATGEWRVCCIRCISTFTDHFTVAYPGFHFGGYKFNYILAGHLWYQ